MAWTVIADLTGPQGDTGEIGPQGLPGFENVPTDPGIAALVSTTGTSQTQTAMDGRYARARDVVLVGPGIDPTGTTDSSAAFQVLLRQAQTTGGTLVVPAGTYLVDGASTQQSFLQPRIVGAGMRQTIIKSTVATAAITFVGGSGQVSGGTVENLTFDSTVTGAVGLELQGCIGVTPRNVRFVSSTRLLFHNKKAGDFTEFCVAENCCFENGTTAQIEYRRTSGNDSFHGSGFRGALINQTTGATESPVLVGANCLVYNAPWGGVFFGRTVGVSPIRIASTRVVTAHGHLSFETNVIQTAVDEASTAALYYGGTTSRISNGISLGTKFIRSTDVSLNSDGSTTSQRDVKSVNYSLSAGSTSLSSFDSGETALVSITVYGSNHAKSYLLYVNIDRATTTNGVVATIGTGHSFDSAALGSPTFSMSAGRLVITNASYSSAITARVSITQLAGRAQSPLI